jgi:hypothetical protein
MLPSNFCCGDFFALHIIGGDRGKHSRIGLLNLINRLFLELIEQICEDEFIIFSKSENQPLGLTTQVMDWF